MALVITNSDAGATIVSVEVASKFHNITAANFDATAISCIIFNAGA